MLVLSRQRDEVIMIVTHDGELIEVTIVDIRGDRVRVGISAPTKISVDRKEVYDAIKAEEKLEAEERQAAKPTPPTRPVERPVRKAPSRDSVDPSKGRKRPKRGS